MLKVFRGVERIRTAVNGVADHCLATRPRHRKFLIFAGSSLRLNESANIEIISFLNYILLVFRRSVSFIVTISTSPPIGGLILLTDTVAFCTNLSSSKMRVNIRLATVSRSFEGVFISSLTTLFKKT